MSYKIFTIGEYIRTNLQNPPTKEMVCEKFDISDYYLRKEFKKVFGLNFGDLELFLHEIVERLMKLLTF